MHGTERESDGIVYRLGQLKGRYVITWREGTRRPRYRLAHGISADEARRELDLFVLRRKLDKGEPTVSSIWSAYKEAKKGRRVAQQMAFEGRKILPHFGSLKPEAIRPAHCEEYIEAQRRAGYHDGTIWTELGHLRTALLWAVEEGLIERAPKIPRPEKPAPKDRWLTRPEAELLIECMELPHLKLATVLLLTTAARHTAILELTWDRVDLERRKIHLALPGMRRKKGRASVPINDTAYALLVEARRGALTDHVIEWAGHPIKSLKVGFNAARARANQHPEAIANEWNFSDVDRHCLRHTAAVWMVSAGIDMELVAQYLGHTSIATTRNIYARFAPEHMRNAAATLEVEVRLNPRPIRKTGRKPL